MIDPQIFFQTFRQQLGSESKVYQVWNKDTWIGSDPWTKAVTAVLAQTTREVVGKETHIAAKGTPDKDGRREYFTLDVCAYRAPGWEPPLIAIEHENECNKLKIQYCSWKLLCVEAQLRVLIAYAHPEKCSSSCVSSRDSLRSAVEEVRNHNQRPILVIAGEWPVVEKGVEWHEQDLRTIFVPYYLGY